MFNYLDDNNKNAKDIIKQHLIELFKINMDELGLKYNYNDKFNTNEIYLKFSNYNNDLNAIYINENGIDFNNILDKTSSVRYLALKNILDKMYKKIIYLRKYMLIRNKYYSSPNIIRLTYKYIIYRKFDIEDDDLNNKVRNYIKLNNINFHEYPSIMLEYNLNTKKGKNICELYNEYLLNIDKTSNEEIKENIKNTYFELINNEQMFVSKKDIKNISNEFDSYELYNFFIDFKEYNAKNKIVNKKIDEIIKYIKENKEIKESNIYTILYGDTNE